MGSKKRVSKTASKNATKLSKSDIESVADKLEAFAKDLPKQEQDVLGWILTRAQAAPATEVVAAGADAVPEVEGFRTPMASQLAKSAGLQSTAKPEVTVVVGWSYAFRTTPGGERVLERIKRPRATKGLATRARAATRTKK